MLVVDQQVDLSSVVCVCYLFIIWRESLQWARASSVSTLYDHTQTRHTRLKSSGRVISPAQRPLPDNTQQSQETDVLAPHVPPWDWNPQSQQASGRRHTPKTRAATRFGQVD